MRNFFFFICQVSLSFLSYAQGVYPLQLGNVWEYWDIWGDGYMFKTTATKDTIMENGRHYTALVSDMGMGTDYVCGPLI